MASRAALLLLLGLSACAQPRERDEGRLVVLGLDGLEWNLVRRMAKRHELPNLSRVLDQGAWAEIRISRPILSPVVWTTYASGYPGEQHGVLGWATAGGRAFSAADVRAWRIWDAATEAGERVLVSNWLVTWPASPVEGHVLTHRFVWSRPMDRTPDEELEAIDRRQHDALRGTIWPPSDQALASSLVPTWDWLVSSPLGYQVEHFGAPHHPLRADELAIRYFEELWPGGDLDLALVYQNGIDQVSHLYWPFVEPCLQRRMIEDPEARHRAIAAYRAAHPGEVRSFPLDVPTTRTVVDRASRWVPDYYRYADRVVGRVMELLDEDDTLVVLSDHGFRPAPSHPLLNGSHRDRAFFAAWGARLRARGEQEPLEELDVGPTLLALAGLPVAEDMPGRVRDDIFELDSWPTVPTRLLQQEAAEPPAELAPVARRLLEQLQALGYVDVEGRPLPLELDEGRVQPRDENQARASRASATAAGSRSSHQPR